MKIWIPKRSLYLKCEVGSKHGKYAVALMVVRQTGGHVPKSLSKISKLFVTLPNCVIKCKIVRNRGGGYRLEIPVQYKFFEPGKTVYWELQIVRSNNLGRNIRVLISWKLFFYPVPTLQKVYLAEIFIWLTNKVSALWLSDLKMSTL